MEEKKFEYYLSDIDLVYAIDQDGKEYFFNARTGKLEEKYNCVDCMWGGCDEEYAKERMAELVQMVKDREAEKAAAEKAAKATA